MSVNKKHTRMVLLSKYKPSPTHPSFHYHHNFLPVT